MGDPVIGKICGGGHFWVKHNNNGCYRAFPSAGCCAKCSVPCITLVLKRNPEVITVTLSILYMGKLRHNECDRDHRASR